MRGLGERSPAVVGLVHVELRITRQRIRLVGHRRVDHLEHEHALAGVRSQGDEGIAEVAAVTLGGRLGLGHQRTAAGVAEQHHRLRPPGPHGPHRSLHVDGRQIVLAVHVVVDVAGGEPEGGVAGGGEQRAGVVGGEVAPGVGQHHGRLPGSPRRRRPQDAADDGAVRCDQRHRFSAHGDARVVGRVRPVPEERPPLHRPPQVGHRQAGVPAAACSAARWNVGTGGASRCGSSLSRMRRASSRSAWVYGAVSVQNSTRIPLGSMV